MEDGRTDNHPYGWDEAAFEAYWGGDDDDSEPCDEDWPDETAQESILSRL